MPIIESYFIKGLHGRFPCKPFLLFTVNIGLFASIAEDRFVKYVYICSFKSFEICYLRMKRNRPLVLNVGIHVLSCIAILLMPLIASPRASIFDTLNIGTPEFRGLISSGLLILCYYLNYYFLLPVLFQHKKFVMWGAVSLFCFMVVLLLPVILVPDFNPPHHFKADFRPTDFSPIPPHPAPEHSFLRGAQFAETILKFLIVYALSLLIRTHEWWRKSQEEKRKAELLSLKAQVNPHFLFNTMNGIYSLALEQSDKTAPVIVKLSELMRYNISEIQNDTVLLSREIEYLKNYIDLQKMRLENTIDVQFRISEINPEMSIAPLLLIPFVENAFKYGVSSAHLSVIMIELRHNNGELLLLIVNEKAGGNDVLMKNETGINNVKRRLELTYPDRHELNITETEHIYRVELKIKMQ